MLLTKLFCVFVVHLCVYFAGTSAQSFEYCKDRAWLKFQNSCYSFSATPQGKVDYYEAEDYCLSRGAHLVSIHSEAENGFLNKAISERYGGRRWIGLNKFQGEDNLQWSDGTDVTYFKEQSKQKYQKELCFFMGKDGWRPDHCNLHNHPICKRPDSDQLTTPAPPRTTVAPKGNCPKDWIQFGEKCYKYFGSKVEERLDYRGARNACSGLGKEYDLVSIHSLEEQAFLTQHLYDFGSSAWIGMRQITSDEVGQDLVFGWIDNSRNDFTYWVQGHPPPGTWRYCARLNYEGPGKGEWFADYCESEKYGYICQRPSDPGAPVQPPKESKCPEGAERYRKSCYKLESDTKTFEEAENTCSKSGGHVVSVSDSFEQAFLFNFIGGKQSAVWIGLRNKEGSRMLKWTDAQSLYYSNWANRQPAFKSSARSCAFLDGINVLKWNLTSCSLKLPYVCEFSEETPEPTPVEVAGTCPKSEVEDSWLDIGDEYCYHVGQSKNHAMSWGQLSRYCTTKGMKLITVTSNHQSNSLGSYLWRERSDIWTGLIKSFDSDSFVWLDGTPLNYTNWAKNEPNNWFDNRDCVKMSPVDLKWKRADCNSYGLTMCQAEKATHK